MAYIQTIFKPKLIHSTIMFSVAHLTGKFMCKVEVGLYIVANV